MSCCIWVVVKTANTGKMFAIVTEISKCGTCNGDLRWLDGQFWHCPKCKEVYAYWRPRAAKTANTEQWIRWTVQALSKEAVDALISDNYHSS